MSDPTFIICLLAAVLILQGLLLAVSLVTMLMVVNVANRVVTVYDRLTKSEAKP